MSTGYDAISAPEVALRTADLEKELLREYLTAADKVAKRLRLSQE